MSGFGYRVTGGAVERVAVKEALACTADFVWVHLTSNEAEAQAWLRDAAKLDDYVVDALTASETRPRCEAFADGALLNLRGRSSEEMASGDPLASVRIWAIKGRVYSVTRRPLIGIADVETQIAAGTIVDPGDFIAAVATAITTDLDPHVADLGDELDDCEERLDANRVFDLRRVVTRVRVTAIGYRRFLSPQRAALEKLAALPGAWLAEDDRRHLAAAADRAARMTEEVESIRERASLMHEALTDLRSEQIDSRSLIISIIAMIFLPLTFITGVYGMNVADLPYAQEPWAFDAIMGLCAAIAATVLGYFAHRHWFQK
ncbi:CorA family divalent cation transporter [Sphingomonas sp. RIT328]|uniref:CorA family divalent cation transporter n=1 Tax=Sphingomonas sp. RIT328 TaxID=1470591 RepID=UPI00044DA9DE|nr:CorA family divalent cation transporter [Sphingomonas sp. RIT328]EZP50964.1 CorA-like Mg2+ transporter family protein [Sphingomonas sp. RIT328]